MSILVPHYVCTDGKNGKYIQLNNKGTVLIRKRALKVRSHIMNA